MAHNARGPLKGAVPEPGPHVDVVVVAAGISNRMAGIDKLRAPLLGRPLLAWTLDNLAAAPSVDRIVLVMADGPAFEALRPYLPPKVVAVVPGGLHRGASVAAGLDALADLDGTGADDARIILVHDGARPLVSVELIEAVTAATIVHGMAIPVVPIPDTVRRLREGELVETLDRSELVAVQTPQGIRAGLLREAFARFPPSGPERFTDEAALLTACTIRVHPIPGDPVNLKVTVPADLPRAEGFLVAMGSARTGTSSDWHPFGPGEPLRLGGLEIAGAPRLHGHSDGDVALHAVADALLGAAALGDLGRLFPADGRTPQGAPSRDLLGAVVARLATEGWRPASVDLTIEGARPRLGDHLDAMRDALATLLGLVPAAVSVKASTGNLRGDAGAGRGIGATALVTLARTAPFVPPLDDGSRRS